MPQIQPLSARIATLEAQAAPLEGLRQSRDDLADQLARVIEQVTQAESAQRTLELLAAQAAAILDGLGETAKPEVLQEQVGPAQVASTVANTPAETPDLPQVVTEPPMPEDPATPLQDALPAQVDTPVTSDNQPAAAEEPGEDEEGEEDQPAPRSSMEILTEYAEGLAAGQEVTPADATATTGIPVGTTKNYLPALAKRGVLEKVPGTGMPGIPARYRRPRTAAVPKPKQVDGTAAPAPETRPPQDGPQDTPDPASGGEAGGATLLSTTQASLPPIPERLSTDECSLFDLLRKEPGGLTIRVLQARLNWLSTRTANVLASLTRLGHVGRNGDRYRVVPAELQGEAAVA